MFAQVRGGYSPTLTPITSTPSQWTRTRSVVTTAAALLLAGARRVTVTRAVIITWHIAHRKNITGLTTCHWYRWTVHECCREEAVCKCSDYIFYVNNVLRCAGDVSVCGRPADQSVAHGDHGPVLQHRGHQARQHGGAHRGHHCGRVPSQGVQSLRLQLQQRNHQTVWHETGKR